MSCRLGQPIAASCGDLILKYTEKCAYTSVLNEMSLELVRQAYFKNLPSRLQSIFACESIADAQAFPERSPPEDFQPKPYHN
jgi:hypothetical protein